MKRHIEIHEEDLVEWITLEDNRKLILGLRFGDGELPFTYDDLRNIKKEYLKQVIPRSWDYHKTF
jgi:hypothetical protein